MAASMFRLCCSLFRSAAIHCKKTQCNLNNQRASWTLAGVVSIIGGSTLHTQTSCLANDYYERLGVDKKGMAGGGGSGPRTRRLGSSLAWNSSTKAIRARCRCRGWSTRGTARAGTHSTITIEARWLCFPFSWLCFPFSFPTYISTPPPPLLPIRLVSM